MKRCSSCGLSLDHSAFHRNRAQPDGYANQCKDCHRGTRARYDATHPTRRSDYYRANKTRINDANAAWERQNRERSNAAHRARYHRHVAASRAYERAKGQRLRAQRARYYHNHKSRIAAVNRQWRRDNHLAARIINARRRHLERQAPGRCTQSQLLGRCVYYGWRCYLCGAQLTLRTVTIDHRIPLSRGGSNWPANLAPACHHCNCAKKASTEREYRARLIG
jgi:5-methylcytosine-specific restriction endonuclease McrA